MTTRGMKEPEMREIAHMIDRVLRDPENKKNIEKTRKSVKGLVKKYPLYKGLIRKLERE